MTEGQWLMKWKNKQEALDAQNGQQHITEFSFTVTDI
jgi:hypothetical protein